MRLVAPVIVATLAVGLVAQQQNSPPASARWNVFDGPQRPIVAAATAAVTGSLPFTVSGAPNPAFAVVGVRARVLPLGIETPYGLLDLDLSAGATVIADGIGLSTGTELDLIANTGPSGSATFVVPVQPGASLYPGACQVPVTDPTSAFGLRLTAATDLLICCVPTGAIYVSSATGAFGNAGCRRAPRPTISAGIAASLASGQPHPPIYVASGS
jgi:hypothetical protein